jgi:hypothetical protein
MLYPAERTSVYLRKQPGGASFSRPNADTNKSSQRLAQGLPDDIHSLVESSFVGFRNRQKFPTYGYAPVLYSLDLI